MTLQEKIDAGTRLMVGVGCTERIILLLRLAGSFLKPNWTAGSPGRKIGNVLKNPEWEGEKKNG